ncbi:MAG: alpha-ketoglutarate-dependent dioxygenase AlkB [Alphaproteobacteria bacterium]|nr:alpha-ketoglutarate-dependent dioxygenase AlkB [Alphaproteobacteria bacterium]
MARDSIFVHGAVIVPDFVTPAEEERILLRIGQAPWMTELSRRVQHYGYRYDYRGASRPEPAAPFPRWSAVMAGRLREHFGGALPVQCIVNEYRSGQGIGMHADHAQFGPVIASLSLAADWPMRFRPRAVRPYARDGLPGDEVVVLPRRSVLVLASAARTHWMHGIDRADTADEAATRLSATFRTLAR